MPPIALLICDDSSMARKLLLRALPADWNVSVTHARNGVEGLAAIRAGLAEVTLLDLTMPEMDGYQVLEAVRAEGLSTQVIVVSGDVQDEAMRRVRELGAIAFIKKPAEPEQLKRILAQAGLLQAAQAQQVVRDSAAQIPFDFFDAMREAVNVAIGQAAALLARVLDVFVHLPVPNVNLLDSGELHMALADAREDPQSTVVCQGYIGNGIAGEALLIFHHCSVGDMARLMKRSALDYGDQEMLLDLSSVLIGACLSGLAEQLDVMFSQGHPQILADRAQLDSLATNARSRWKQTLAVEISYRLDGYDIHFDLLLLFTEDSVERLRSKLDYLMG